MSFFKSNRFSLDTESINQFSSEDIDDLAIFELFLETQEAEEEVHEAIVEDEDMDEMMVHFEEPCRNIDHVISMVEKKGLSTLLMNILDPKDELSHYIPGGYQRIDSIKSASELKDIKEAFCVSLQNQHDQIINERDQILCKMIQKNGYMLSNEGVDNGLKDIVLFAFLGPYIYPILKIIAIILRTNGSRRKYLTTLRAKLNMINSFDTEKFNSKKVKAYSKEQFEEILTNLNTVVKFTESGFILNIINELISATEANEISSSKIESIITNGFQKLSSVYSKNGIGKYLGFYIDANSKNFIDEEDEENNSAEGKLVTVRVSKDTLANLKWTPESVKEDVIKCINFIDESEKMLAKADNQLKALSSKIKSIKKAIKTTEDKTASKLAARTIKKFIVYYKISIRNTVKLSFDMNKTIVRVAQAAVSSANSKNKLGLINRIKYDNK